MGVMNQLTGGHHPVDPRTIQGPVRVSILVQNKEATDTIVGRKKAPGPLGLAEAQRLSITEQVDHG